jgi:hypothetical protein
MYRSYFQHSAASVPAGSPWLVATTPDCPGPTPGPGTAAASAFFDERPSTMVADWIAPFHHPHHLPMGEPGPVGPPAFPFYGVAGSVGGGGLSNTSASPSLMSSATYRRQHGHGSRAIIGATAGRLNPGESPSPPTPTVVDDLLTSRGAAAAAVAAVLHGQTPQVHPTSSPTVGGYGTSSSSIRQVVPEMEYERQLHQASEYSPETKPPPLLKRSDSFSGPDDNPASSGNAASTTATGTDSFSAQSSAASSVPSSLSAISSSAFNGLYQRFSPFVSAHYPPSSAPAGSGSGGATLARSTTRGFAVVPPSPQKQQQVYQQQPQQPQPAHPTAMAYRYHHQQTSQYHHLNGNSHSCGRNSAFPSSSPGYGVPTEGYGSGLGPGGVGAAGVTDDGGALMSAALFHSAAAAAAAAAGMLKHHQQQQHHQAPPTSYIVGGPVRLRTKSHSSSGMQLSFIFTCMAKKIADMQAMRARISAHQSSLNIQA